MKSSIRFLIVTGLLGSGSGLLIRHITRGEVDPFNPNTRSELVSLVNSRPVRSLEPSCAQTEPEVGADPVEQVRQLGAVSGKVLVLRITHELFNTALDQVPGLTVGRRLKLYERADKLFFRPGTVSFAVFNSGEQDFLTEHEPGLVAERSGRGRLVGISLNAATGFDGKQPALLTFEDKICDGDTGFALEIFFESDQPQGVKRWFSSTGRRFHFSDPDGVTEYLSATFAQFAPEAQVVAGVELPAEPGTQPQVIAGAEQVAADEEWTTSDSIAAGQLVVGILSLLAAL